MEEKKQDVIIMSPFSIVDCFHVLFGMFCLFFSLVSHISNGLFESFALKGINHLMIMLKHEKMQPQYFFSTHFFFLITHMQRERERSRYCLKLLLAHSWFWQIHFSLSLSHFYSSIWHMLFTHSLVYIAYSPHITYKIYMYILYELTPNNNNRMFKHVGRTFIVGSYFRF